MTSIYAVSDNPFNAIIFTRLLLDNKEGKHARNVYNIVGFISDFGGLQ